MDWLSVTSLGIFRLAVLGVSWAAAVAYLLYKRHRTQTRALFVVGLTVLLLLLGLLLVIQPVLDHDWFFASLYALVWLSGVRLFWKELPDLL